MTRGVFPQRDGRFLAVAGFGHSRTFRFRESAEAWLLGDGPSVLPLAWCTVNDPDSLNLDGVLGEPENRHGPIEKPLHGPIETCRVMDMNSRAKALRLRTTVLQLELELCTTYAQYCSVYESILSAERELTELAL